MRARAKTDAHRRPFSIGRLAADPWSRVGTEFELGQDLDATITRLMPFGAFARIAEGLEGLIHMSELAPQRIADPSEVVQVGDRVRVRVVGSIPIGDVSPSRSVKRVGSGLDVVRADRSVVRYADAPHLPYMM